MPPTTSSGRRPSYRSWSSRASRRGSAPGVSRTGSARPLRAGDAGGDARCSSRARSPASSARRSFGEEAIDGASGGSPADPGRGELSCGPATPRYPQMMEPRGKFRDRIRAEVKKRLRIDERKLHLRQVKKTTWALVLTAPYLIFEWSGRTFFLYAAWPSADSVIHFSFGVAFASVAALIYDKSGRFIGTWTVILSFLWEGLEQWGEILMPNQPAEYVDIFFWDGVMDITMNILGATLIYRILKRTGLLGITSSKSGATALS